MCPSPRSPGATVRDKSKASHKRFFFEPPPHRQLPKRSTVCSQNYHRAAKAVEPISGARSPRRRAAAKDNQSNSGTQSPRQGCCNVCGIAATGRCANCKRAVYCSREHQALDWDQHRPGCNAITQKHQRDNHEASRNSASSTISPLCDGPANANEPSPRQKTSGNHATSILSPAREPPKIEASKPASMSSLYSDGLTWMQETIIMPLVTREVHELQYGETLRRSHSDLLCSALCICEGSDPVIIRVDA